MLRRFRDTKKSIGMTGAFFVYDADVNLCPNGGRLLGITLHSLRRRRAPKKQFPKTNSAETNGTKTAQERSRNAYQKTESVKRGASPKTVGWQLSLPRVK